MDQLSKNPRRIVKQQMPVSNASYSSPKPNEQHMDLRESVLHIKIPKSGEDSQNKNTAQENAVQQRKRSEQSNYDEAQRDAAHNPDEDTSIPAAQQQASQMVITEDSIIKPVDQQT